MGSEYILLNLMKQLECLELKQGYAVLSPVGAFSFDEITHLLSRAVVYCRRRTIGKLMFISIGASGFQSAGIAEQYGYVEKFASDSASLVKIAHVASPKWVHSGKFRITAAKNRGLELGNFKAESAALKWRLQPARKSSDKLNNPAFESGSRSLIEG
jgi:hypothetical protein